MELSEELGSLYQKDVSSNPGVLSPTQNFLMEKEDLCTCASISHNTASVLIKIATEKDPCSNS